MFNNMMYVYEVYKEKSFSRAAANLYISQPSLSATIKKVENRIGAPLFDRSTNPVQLTECGAEYIKCVQKIMDIESGFSHYMNDLNDLATGQLIIGASNFFTCYVLPSLIRRFTTVHPGVTVRLIEADTSQLVQKLAAGSLDLVIDNFTYDESLYKKNLCYRESLLVAVRSEMVRDSEAWPFALTVGDILAGAHDLPATRAVPVALLAPLPFVVLRQGNDTRMRAEKIFAEAGVELNIAMKLDQLATAYHIASNGIGATLLSDTLVKKMRPGDDMVYFKLDSPHAQRNTYFFHKRGKYVSRSMEELLKMAQEL